VSRYRLHTAIGRATQSQEAFGAQAGVGDGFFGCLVKQGM
jgi:hypothetical protein